MTKKGPAVAACIPAFNEEATIARVVLTAERFVDRVLVCDDGSTDMTGVIAEALGAEVVFHETNLGYGAALQSLFKEVLERGFETVVTLDSNGQHDPSDIPKLLKRLSLGDVDIVIGSRFLEGGGSEAPAWRRAGIQAITGIVANGGVKVTDAQSGFRAYTRHALESLSLTEEGMGLSTEILVKAGSQGLKVAEVPIHVTHDESLSTPSPAAHGSGPVPATLNRGVEGNQAADLEATHGSGLVLATLKHISIRHPLLLYGGPGLISLATSLIFWVWTLQIFAATREISTNIALISVGATIVGLTLMTTSIILWVIVGASREKS